MKKKIFFLQNTNILMHAYHLILIKPFPILQTLVSCNTGDFICKHKSPSSNTCCYCQLFQWNDQKWKKKKPTKLYSSCLGVGWGRAVSAYRGKLLATVQVDGAHKRPRSWVFKNGLTRNPYLGEWQHTVKKKRKKNHCSCVLALRCRPLPVSRSLVTTLAVS